ncbi:MAG TPA: UDP-N-acetylmuramoyl-L-alanine--D-glutamate ligase [Clostridiales bacterium]|jgi:UDP-N-acetylmuramoylalanine--D-glutamate ligase|nr:UDP-N-acetylmuramoyl-L-alanine--D-glutamate ligase [Clostridiales bacterium]
MKNIQRKKILIAGLGRSGMAAARLLSAQGADVYGFDGKAEDVFPVEDIRELENLDVHCFFGREPDIFDFVQVVASPGMPLTAPVLANASRKGVEIIGELELAYRSRPSAFVAITGTNGKTTTTALVGEMYRLAGMPHRIVGNIGMPVADQILTAEAEAVMVTEVSSFQLETIVDFRPHVAAILNITPDHLDRHGRLEEYIRIKFRIFENQVEGDYCIYNADDAICAGLSDSAMKGNAIPFSARGPLVIGAYVEDERILIAGKGSARTDLCGVKDLKIPGAHNLENALAAAATAFFAGVPTVAIREALCTFGGVEHRIESVARINGVAYINDSKGTNPDAAIKAIQAVSSPLLLIAGGYEKNADFDPFTAAFEGRVQHLLLLGETAQRIAQSARTNGFPESSIHFCRDMAQCVAEAARLARPGDAVLLSPACASWGMYNNFEERGRHFKELVHALEK